MSSNEKKGDTRKERGESNNSRKTEGKKIGEQVPRSLTRGVEERKGLIEREGN
jgi:hypothetical protein